MYFIHCGHKSQLSSLKSISDFITTLTCLNPLPYCSKHYTETFERKQISFSIPDNLYRNVPCGNMLLNNHEMQMDFLFLFVVLR